ncbi:hypothetical protein HNP84_001876 [Thermocatellispora tengchongensis]|uniref:Uncharacterized protein n=1 Tax=Thermocatellispora tengchongensis TaxID=1073253 RepID=A0A840P2K9_9ACTN|nr:hypothetical protein [Thermocatellispora tengchongensis]MBB5132163.1 hypothetical protein [Thermocatellispora tengchongensis]
MAMRKARWRTACAATCRTSSRSGEGAAGAAPRAMARPGSATAGTEGAGSGQTA